MATQSLETARLLAAEHLAYNDEVTRDQLDAYAAELIEPPTWDFGGLGDTIGRQHRPPDPGWWPLPWSRPRRTGRLAGTSVAPPASPR